MLENSNTPSPQGASIFSEIARAKVNLTLHVGQAITDSDDRFYNYHPLSSLVVFSNIGDIVRATVLEPNSSDEFVNATLSLSGPNGPKLLENDPTNLILKAYTLVSDAAPLPPIDFHLVKNF